MSDWKTTPPGPWLLLEDVLKMLRKATKGNQKEWAEKHGMSQQYVSDVLLVRRLPGDKITRALGLEKAMMWRVPGKAVRARKP